MFQSLHELTQSSTPDSYEDLIGVVIDNKDPDKAQRVRLEIPGLFEKSALSSLPWVQGIANSSHGGAGSNFGNIDVPAIGARVKVRFPVTNGTTDYSNGKVVESVPISLNSPSAKFPEELTINYPDRFGQLTPSGFVWFHDEKTGEALFRNPKGFGFHLSGDGVLSIKFSTINLIGDNMNAVISNDIRTSSASSTETVEGTKTMVTNALKISSSGQVDVSASKVFTSCDVEAAGQVKGADGIFGSKSFLSHLHKAQGPTSPTTPPM